MLKFFKGNVGFPSQKMFNAYNHLLKFIHIYAFTSKIL